MDNSKTTMYRLDNFDLEFVTELFLDSDSVSTMNRLIVAVADVVTENNENITMLCETYKDQYNHVLKLVENESYSLPFSPREINYYEGIVLHFEDEDYIARFKMKKTTVQALISFLSEYIKPSNTNISLDKKVHVFLWLLTSDSSYSEVGALFGLNKSSVSYVLHEIAMLLADQRYHFINWPSIEEQHVTRIKVNSRFKFPNCVGFIDTCRFNIGSKKKKKEKLDTILLQGVCDESLMFIDIHVGNIGQTKKYKIFKESSLSDELKNFVHFENHILGDSEYKLRKNLITPFSSDELLTREEMKFNEVHWKTRSYIGHAFELVKERFKRLNHMDISNPITVSTLICSACVLHNFIMLQEGCAEIKEEIVTCDDAVIIDTSIVTTAYEKRQFLCNYINYIDLDDASLTNSVE